MSRVSSRNNQHIKGEHHKCEECSGRWISIEALKEQSEGRLPRQFPKKPLKLYNDKEGVKCPHDGAITRVCSSFGVNIDVCPECYGVWFDTSELTKALTNIDKPYIMPLSSEEDEAQALYQEALRLAVKIPY
jgi:Zn-finger nucleic acid-binding protein